MPLSRRDQRSLPGRRRHARRLCPAARAPFVAALGDDAPYDQWLTLDHYERWLAGEFDDFQAFLPRKREVPKLARVGLEDLVDVVVISDEVGVSKPDPAIFEHAHGAGLRAVWLDRPGSHDGSALDFAVGRSLAEVPALLR